MSNNLGVIKEIDALGRLVISKDMRDVLGLSKKVEMVLTTEGILLRNPKYKLVKIEKTKKGREPHYNIFEV